ncbi:MAG TPA: hypothetical protein VFB12_18365 [Ktedonobacteraceae bacterium]|nr:hypothetical protein [Ktedonobacteraceae bacterium]
MAYAAYHAFAAEIKEKRNGRKSRVFLVDTGDEISRVRFADEYIDVVVSLDNGNGSIQYYNWFTHQRMELASSWSAILRDLREMGSFYKADFVNKFASTMRGEVIFHHLVKYRMLAIER